MRKKNMEGQERTELRREQQGKIGLAVSIIFGIAVNVLLSFLSSYFGLPLWLDTIGTITAAALGGVLPGLLTAVGTSVLCTLFNSYAVYNTIIGILIAVCTAGFVSREGFRKKSGILLYIITLALLGGVLGTLFQWAMFGGEQYAALSDAAALLSGSSGLGTLPATILVSIGLNLVDKGLAAGIAFLILYLVPEEKRAAIRDSLWRQRPLSKEERRRLREQGREGAHGLLRRVGIILAVVVISLTAILCFISLNLYYENEKKNYTENAKSAASFAADVIDPERVDVYLREGREAAGYEETEALLYHIRDNTPGVEYLYVVKIRQDGCYVIFDLEAEDEEAFAVGEKIEFEEAFQEYLPVLFDGGEIPPIESNDISGWVMTAYEPVRDAEGKTVCYAAADVSLRYLTVFVRDFFVKMLLVFSGFLFLILCCGMWASRYFLAYPIGSMTVLANDFIRESDDQKALDQKVRSLKALKIRTGDEVEKLYHAIVRMATGFSERMREVSYYADATAQMQNGLIMTMADMVENRDSDTGAHIQKTAEYVKIIAQGLKKKGYYAEKLTPKYISDVVMSAPLHDVGKINIPDAVLNKPGKLTDEEYEIMKTHASAGKEIMERAINTVQGENYLKEARNMAAYHHERWDGKGYPDGLSGEVIPLSARIMAVADVFDALASPRVYKPAFPLEKALRIIEEGAGTQFDPKCVEVFLEALPEVKLVLKKYHES